MDTLFQPAPRCERVREKRSKPRRTPQQRVTPMLTGRRSPVNKYGRVNWTQGMADELAGAEDARLDQQSACLEDTQHAACPCGACTPSMLERVPLIFFLPAAQQ